MTGFRSEIRISTAGWLLVLIAPSAAAGQAEPECARPQPGWIWCDDFERDRLARYFEYADRRGSFVRVEGVGVGGSHGMRTTFEPGQVEAGFLHLAFGKTPQLAFRPADDGRERVREVYWRFYFRTDSGWTGGGGDKLTRATSLVSGTSWAQGMIAHVWSMGEGHRYLGIDPASGTDPQGNVRTTTYNDFPNLRWLGKLAGRTPVFAPGNTGRWYCIEAHVRLNRPGASDGVFRLWIDGRLEAARDNLNWVGAFDAYGINAVFLENYWNRGSPVRQSRYLDNFVVSRAPIGCLSR